MYIIYTCSIMGDIINSNKLLLQQQNAVFCFRKIHYQKFMNICFKMKTVMMMMLVMNYPWLHTIMLVLLLRHSGHFSYVQVKAMVFHLPMLYLDV